MSGIKGKHYGSRADREARNDVLVRDYLAGALVETLAERFDLEPLSIRQILHVRGIPLRKEKQRDGNPHAKNPLGRLPKRERGRVEARLIELYLSGMHTSRIAQRFGLSRVAVYRLVEQHGVSRRLVKKPVTSRGGSRVSKRTQRTVGDAATNDLRKGTVTIQQDGLVVVTRKPGQQIRNPEVALSWGFRRILKARAPADVTIYDKDGRVVRVLDGETKREKPLEPGLTP